MAVRGIATKLGLDRDQVRNFINSIKGEAPKSKEMGEVALGVVAQRAREEVQAEATLHTNEVFILGREVLREYKVVAAAWGLSVSDYLGRATKFHEDNVDRVKELREANTVLRQLVEQAAAALKPLPLRRAMLERMIDKGHRFTREEVEFFLWGEVRGCIRCGGGGEQERAGGASKAGGGAAEAKSGAKAQDAVGGGGGSRPRAQPARAGDGTEEGRGREDVPAQAEASVGGEANG